MAVNNYFPREKQMYADAAPNENCEKLTVTAAYIQDAEGSADVAESAALEF